MPVVSHSSQQCNACRHPCAAAAWSLQEPAGGSRGTQGGGIGRYRACLSTPRGRGAKRLRILPRLASSGRRLPAARLEASSKIAAALIVKYATKPARGLTRRRLNHWHPGLRRRLQVTRLDLDLGAGFGGGNAQSLYRPPCPPSTNWRGGD